MLRRIVGFGFVFAICALADEGMWLFDHFPQGPSFEDHPFTVTVDFLGQLPRTRPAQMPPPAQGLHRKNRKRSAARPPEIAAMR
jgi:hypothetical protein